MRILITGGRAPVALEWARLLMKQGHQVYLSDCCQFPLGRFVSSIHKYIETVSPNSDPEKYKEQMISLLKKNKIEMLIPTCEEIFHLAKIKHLFTDTNCLICDTNLLLQLHDKKQVFDVLANLPGIKLPKTVKITSIESIDLSWESILKPVFCRFGEQIIRNIKAINMSEINISTHQPWVQQQKIIGQALCNYALFDQGKLIAHQVYKPDYCVNHSAATYFQPIENKNITIFMNAFAKQHHFHGQISFDFIEHQGDCYVIECNPRATSGLHLMSERLFWPNTPQVKSLQTSQAQHVGLSMLIAGGIRPFFKRATWSDYQKGKNVLKNQHYPLRPWALILSGGELFLKSLRQQQSLAATSTKDIEWNGET